MYPVSDIPMGFPQNALVAPQNQKSLPRLIFLDLDNTLIPTSWMMEQWRNADERTGSIHARTTLNVTAAINKRLEEAGLFSALDHFFGTIVRSARGPQRIVIVTNAAIKTVESFYLMYCIPQLASLLDKYRIPIRSTERWLEKCGPVPLPAQEAEFREFYTHIKLLQFEEELRLFSEALQIRKSQHSLKHHLAYGIPVGGEFQSEKVRFDVVSVGDQLCEIVAAVRLGIANSSIIRHTKLLMILDLMSDRFISSTPEDFVCRLQDTLNTLIDIALSKTPTVISQRSLEIPSHTNAENSDNEFGTNKTSVYGVNTTRPDASDSSVVGRPRLSSKIAVWVSKSHNLAYCIGRPDKGHFHDDCPYFASEIIPTTGFNVDAVGLNNLGNEDETCCPNQDTSDYHENCSRKLNYDRRRDTTATASTAETVGDEDDEENTDEIEDTLVSNSHEGKLACDDPSLFEDFESVLSVSPSLFEKDTIFGANCTTAEGTSDRLLVSSSDSLPVSPNGIQLLHRDQS